MKTTTITKLDFFMLLLSCIPCLTLLSTFAQVSITGTLQVIVSIINTCCIVLCLVYGIGRMLRGYQNIAALFTMCISSLFALSYCAMATGFMAPYFF